MLSPGWILTFCWNPWLSVVCPKSQVSGTGVATGNISIETSCMDYWSGQGKVSLIDLTPKKLIIKGASKPLIHSKRSLKLFSFPATRCMPRVRRHRQLCRTWKTSHPPPALRDQLGLKRAHRKVTMGTSHLKDSAVSLPWCWGCWEKVTNKTHMQTKSSPVMRGQHALLFKWISDFITLFFTSQPQASLFSSFFAML